MRVVPNSSIVANAIATRFGKATFAREDFGCLLARHSIMVSRFVTPARAETFVRRDSFGFP